MADNRNLLSKAWDQVNPWDSGRTFKNPTPNNTKTATVKTPSYQPSTSVDTSAYDKQISDSNATINSLLAQLAAQPKLPIYNTSEAWARAQKNAENVVNPVYVDKLNQYLEGKRLKVAQTTQQTDINKAGIQTDLAQALEDAATLRTRTNEDTTTKLADVAATEGNYQDTSGTQFDRARAALLGGVADAGLTTSGIGQQQEANATSDRNKAEAEQTRQFNNEREATRVFQTRTLEDVGKSETRAKGSAETRTKQEDINLKNFIDNADLEEKSYRYQNEAERLSEIAAQTNNQYQIGVRDWINALAGSGARSQDIALAQQVYAL